MKFKKIKQAFFKTFCFALLTTSALCTSSLASAKSLVNLTYEETEVLRIIKANIDNWTEKDPVYRKLDDQRKRYYRKYKLFFKEDSSAELLSKIIFSKIKTGNKNITTDNVYNSFLAITFQISLASFPYIPLEGAVEVGIFEQKMVDCFLNRQTPDMPPIKTNNFVKDTNICRAQILSTLPTDFLGKYLISQMRAEFQYLVNEVDVLTGKLPTFLGFDSNLYDDPKKIRNLIDPNFRNYDPESQRAIYIALEQLTVPHTPMEERTIRKMLWLIIAANEPEPERKKLFSLIYANIPFFALIE